MISDKNIDNGAPFDWGKASKDYASYRDIYPKEFYDKIISFGIGKKGQRILDLGTGTGVLPRNLASTGAYFTGVDISPEQLAEAARLSAEAGLDISYISSKAEDIDFEENSFDCVTACQCFFYFDPEILAPILKKILIPKGLLGIMFVAWLPNESRIAQASEELVLKYSPDWSGAGLKRKHFEVPYWVSKFGFTVKHNTGLLMDIPFSKISWAGRIRACRGVGASLSEEKTAEFDKEHMALLDKLTSQETFTIPHYASILILQSAKKRT